MLNYTLYKQHTLIVGSGSAGLNAAVQLQANGIKDIAILSEGFNMGTSINTGSDKQTYYKIGLYGQDKDSPENHAHSLWDGGSMHGDIALIEASLSARAFLNLVNLGVKFPQDAYGQFVGYKTDHDPLQRATSFGPYTSREMCRVLIDEVKRRNIKSFEKRIAISLITTNDNGNKRASGIIAINTEKSPEQAIEVFMAENIVFAVGGPAGIYKTSVYPLMQTGAIGLALQKGAMAQSLPESQFGAGSTKFRWNVSGTYMQVIPKIISTATDGVSDVQEFLLPYFKNAGAMNSAIFLKGYQWPFDTRKMIDGSSLIDILIFIETAIKGRRVFMDFRHNSTNFDFDELSDEAYAYLKKSNAFQTLPIERLRKMNPDAITLYEDHNIHLVAEPLEIDICSQHNNGGLATNIWWESKNIKHLFPIGEACGSHGVYRPGGAALNAGQVAGYRIADFISNCYDKNTLDETTFIDATLKELKSIETILDIGKKSKTTWQIERETFQNRMSTYGSHLRNIDKLKQAIQSAWQQYERFNQESNQWQTVIEMAEVMRNQQLCLSHCIYLEAILFQLESGVGSRGSAMVQIENGKELHPKLGKDWYFQEQNTDFINKILETTYNDIDRQTKNNWIERRKIPKSDAWFETAWADYRNGKIFDV